MRSDIIEVTIEKKNLIEIRSITHMIDGKSQLGEYKQENLNLSGKIDTTIEFFISTTDKLQKKDISHDFLIVLDKKIEDIKLTDIRFNVIDNQGVEMEYTLTLTLTEVDEVDEIKKEILDEACQELDNALDYREEYTVEPERTIIEPIEIEKEIKEKKEEIFLELEESYKTYKILYIKDEEEIETIANKYNRNAIDIYEENNFDIKDKIILSIDD